MFDINKCYDCFATEPNSAYFWSGLGENGQDIAAQVAQDNGGTTLEMLMDKNKDELISAGFPYDEDLGGFCFSKENAQDWQAVSQAYAEQASGDVHAVLGENVREGSVWNTKELPALEKNDNVDKVVSVDPKTRKEKDVLLDKKSSESSSSDSSKSSTSKEGSDNHLSGEKSTERGTKPSQEDNPPSNKAPSSEGGQKPTEDENKSQGNNSTPRGEKPQEAPQNISGASQTQRGTPPDSTGGEDSKAPTSSSSNPSDKVSASSNSAKAADEASKVASDQAAQNVALKPNGMGM